MSQAQIPLLAFNRGLISRLGLARVDLTRSAWSAEESVNWMPRALGSMMLRPGLEFKHETRGSNRALHLPFVFSTEDTAIIELTGGKMRVIDHNEQFVSIPSFDTGAVQFGAWTDASTGTGSTAGPVLDAGPAGLAARRATADITGVPLSGANRLLYLQIEVTRGKALVRAGTTAGGRSLLDTELGPGRYSLRLSVAQASTTLHVEVASDLPTATRVVGPFLGGGQLELDTPWPESSLQNLRWDQSGDVIFVASGTERPYRIERRAGNSWAIAEFVADAGPFGPLNLSRATLQPNGLSGTVFIATEAARPVFRTGRDEGRLVRIASQGQQVMGTFSAANLWTDPIRIAGVGASRVFSISRSGTWDGTVRLQRSVGAPGDWATVADYTSNGTVSFNDGFDNQIIYYRIGIPAGGYTSGAAEVSLIYSAGSIEGVARIVAVSGDGATADVIKPFGSLEPSADWYLGSWYPGRWPTALALFDGRLWFAGRDNIWGSVSDAFSNFDDRVEGDSGPISRNLGSGPVDNVHWLLGLSQLVIGTAGGELVAKSSSFDEPLTPTQFRLVPASSHGSCRRQPAVKVDTTGVFVQCGDARVYEMAYDGGQFNYQTEELTSIVPDIAEGLTIDKMTVQRQPDTRIHCVLSDGTVAALVYDRTENVSCWLKIETDGVVEDVVVLPGAGEERVYYCVRREVGGHSRRFLERWAREKDARGGPINRMADSHVLYEGTAKSVLTEADLPLWHLCGVFDGGSWGDVVVWADGKDVGPLPITQGPSGLQLALPSAASTVVVGRGYRARYKTAKIGSSLEQGRISLGQRQRLNTLGLVLADTHARGLRFGASYERMDPLPAMFDGRPVDPDSIWQAFDYDVLPVPGDWTTDMRLHLEANAPRPCTILGAIVDMTLNRR